MPKTIREIITQINSIILLNFFNNINFKTHRNNSSMKYRFLLRMPQLGQQNLTNYFIGNLFYFYTYIDFIHIIFAFHA